MLYSSSHNFKLAFHVPPTPRRIKMGLDREKSNKDIKAWETWYAIRRFHVYALTIILRSRSTSNLS
jgi:hypothetical protein